MTRGVTAAVWAVAGESKSIDLENYIIESASASLGDVTVTDEQGVLDGTPSVEGTALKYKLKAAALKGQKAIISVLVQPKNYVEYKVATTVTVDKNYVGGTPGYTPITEDGKTLADANLSCEGRFKDVAGNVVDGRVEWLDDPSAVVEADQAYQWCFIPMSPGEYAHVYGTITPYVKRVAPTVNAPTPKSGLVYNGESQVLINKGRSSGGEMQYSLKSGEEYSTALPTAVNAGKYTVYYKVVGDEDYADVAEQSIEVIVKAQTPKGTPTYRKVTASGKTLADAELTAPEGWPTGRILWMNGEAGMSPATPVTKGTAYEWVFIPDASQNYTSTGGELVLWAASGGGGGGSASSAPTVTVPVSSDNGSVKVDAAVSGSIAAVKVSGAQLDKVLADGANTVTVDVSGVKNVDSIKFPAALLSKISEAKGSGLTAVLPTGSVTMDNRALASISKGRDVIVSVKSIPISQLTAEQKNAIGEQNSVAAVVDVEVLVGGVKQSDFGGGKLTISIPYTPKDGENSSDLTVLFIQSDGTVENKGGRYDAKTKCFVFETDHLSRYLLVNTSKAGSFTDVSAEDWYFEAVKWAAAQNITGGVGNNQFAPNLACTRAQIVTFLWRSAGCPEGTAAENHFTDIDSNAYYYKAVLWAVENNIANGMSDTVFSPNTACTRAQIVTFLWRSAGCPEMTAAENHFTDIDAGAYYYKAVLWAIENNITNGMSDTAFGPNTACTRAQIVTLLYRSAK